MRRAVLLGILFGIFFLLDVSFFSSLPAFFPFLPLIVAGSLYLLQHHGITEAVWWLPAYGFLLDTLHLGPVPFETFIYTASAGVAFAASRRLFTNRSLYGILAAGALAFLVIALGEFLFLLLADLRGMAVPSVAELAGEGGKRLAGVLALLLFFFLLAPRLRPLVRFI